MNSRNIDSRRESYKAWIAAGLWLFLIAIESTDMLSAQNTSSLLYALATSLFGPISMAKFYVWHTLLRKTGHVLGYGTLSWLLFRAWRTTISLTDLRRWSFDWARASFFMTVLVACLDEWHQSFLPSRTGSVQDVVLDSSAALAVQVGMWFVLRQRSPRR